MSQEARYEEELISAFVHKYPEPGRTIHALVHDFGGVQSLIGELESRGFDDQMNTWMFAKKPKAIPSEQMKNIFDETKMERLAGSLGLTRVQVEAQLAQYLPKLFHQLAAGDENTYSSRSPPPLEQTRP
jgi:uncharacterized protein YidB (DUF937 family)